MLAHIAFVAIHAQAVEATVGVVARRSVEAHPRGGDALVHVFGAIGAWKERGKSGNVKK